MSEQCRACLSVTETLTSLFVESTQFGITLLDCFKKCSGIVEIDDSDFKPKFICASCLLDLQISHTFREKCMQSDLQFRQRLEIVNADDVHDVQEKIDCDLIIEIMKDESADRENDILVYTIVDDCLTTQPHDVPSPSERTKSLPRIQTAHFHQEDSCQELKGIEKHDAAHYSISKEIQIDEDIACVQELASEDQPADLDETDDIILDRPKASAKNSNWFECAHCKKGFKLQISLRKHIEQQHSGKRLHLCNFCGKMCGSEVSLRTHLLQHQKGISPYQCSQCEKSYFSKNGLASHTLTHSKQKPDSNFLCSECGKGFTTRQRLRMHTYTHTGERNFGCDLCDKSFATEFRLRSHRRTHTGERPYQCLECGQTFAQGNALKCHKRVHTGEKPYKCKFCSKCFTQNTILKTHMTLHTGKTVKCPDCDKKFSRASYLILHRREHTGEKPYACEMCPNRYKQKSHLDRHMDTHMGVRYKCEVCKKEYSKQWSLKMHMFKHTEAKPYKCDECTVAFVRRDKYKLHMKSIHKKIVNDVKMAIVQDV